MLTGAHAIIYSKNPAADRAFLRDVLKLPNVDVGEGWLIFGLPPAEIAVHPSDNNDVHVFYFMCEDVKKFVAEMKTAAVECEPIEDLGLGPADLRGTARRRPDRRLSTTARAPASRWLGYDDAQVPDQWR